MSQPRGKQDFMYVGRIIYSPLKIRMRRGNVREVVIEHMTERRNIDRNE